MDRIECLKWLDSIIECIEGNGDMSVGRNDYEVLKEIKRQLVIIQQSEVRESAKKGVEVLASNQAAHDKGFIEGYRAATLDIIKGAKIVKKVM